MSCEHDWRPAPRRWQRCRHCHALRRPPSLGSPEPAVQRLHPLTCRLVHEHHADVYGLCPCLFCEAHRDRVLAGLGLDPHPENVQG